MSTIENKSRELFMKAVEKSPSEWPAFMDQNCDSPELRAKVQGLLDLHVRSGDFLSKSAAATYPHLVSPYGDRIEEFKIIRQIGKGGMGTVYLAEDTTLMRPVALKIVTHTKEDSDMYVDRFKREARAAARLMNPSIVQVFRSGEGNGFSFIAMEFVEGTTLAERFESQKKSTKPYDPKWLGEIARLVSEVADALEYAHRASVIHRDVKPSNILLDTNGHARLSDFGIARITTEQTLMQTGDIVGSLAYMSPEQARVCKNEVDHRTDIFSLGVVLYEAISSRRPFAGITQLDVFKALAEGRPTPLRKIYPSIPLDLATICHKAIENDVTHRYQTAAHMSADLRCFVDGHPILARPPSLLRRARNWARNYKLHILIASIFLLAFSVVALSAAFLSARNAMLGELIVTEKHRGATVSATRFNDDLTPQSPVILGQAPLSVHLQPGLYRVAIDDGESKRFASSIIDQGGKDSVEVNMPKDDYIAAFVAIPGGEYVLGAPGFTNIYVRLRTVHLRPFRISPTEVSNREYREFVLATNGRSPDIWPTPYDVSLDELPVTDVTWDEANNYCRWRGVRLSSPNEWEVAALGPGKTIFPWGRTFHPAIRREDSETLDANTYLRFVRPVRSDLQFATPRGVMHMMSNVQEYTEGIAIDRNRGVIVKGRSWADTPYRKPSDISVLSSRSVGSYDRGFRVAIGE